MFDAIDSSAGTAPPEDMLALFGAVRELCGQEDGGQEHDERLVAASTCSRFDAAMTMME